MIRARASLPGFERLHSPHAFDNRSSSLSPLPTTPSLPSLFRVLAPHLRALVVLDLVHLLYPCHITHFLSAIAPTYRRVLVPTVLL